MQRMLGLRRARDLHGHEDNLVGLLDEIGRTCFVPYR
jgi:hypothetical protein